VWGANLVILQGIRGTDVAGDASTTATIEVGQTVRSEIFGEGDADAFAITIEAGQTVLFSQAVERDFARSLTLRDADGNFIASGKAVHIS